VLTGCVVDLLAERIDLALRLGTLDDVGALTASKSASARGGSWERQRTSVEWVFLPRQLICTPMKRSSTTNAPAEPNGPSNVAAQRSA
jgi:hypothetical protein